MCHLLCNVIRFLYGRDVAHLKWPPKYQRPELRSCRADSWGCHSMRSRYPRHCVRSDVDHVMVTVDLSVTQCLRVLLPEQQARPAPGSNIGIANQHVSAAGQGGPASADFCQGRRQGSLATMPPRAAMPRPPCPIPCTKSGASSPPRGRLPRPCQAFVRGRSSWKWRSALLRPSSATWRW